MSHMSAIIKIILFYVLFIAKEKLKNIIKKNTFSGNISNKNTDKIKIQLSFDCGSFKS